MPNWVTNKIKAPDEVIQALLNDEGRVDFSRIKPFEGEFPWDGVSIDAETAAENLLRLPLNDHPLVATLQKDSRVRSDVSALSDEGFEQFVQMLRNHRKTGFMHSMDFARSAWGTKWNACNQGASGHGQAAFDTAWSFPEPIFVKLSENFPDAIIEVAYADEDIGSNCGTVIFKGGAAVSRDESAGWDSMSEDEQKKWQAFAYDVKGWDPEPDED